MNTDSCQAFELRGVSRTYVSNSSKVPALRDVDLKILRGASYAIMGRSGSGKSTLLGLLGLMDRPTAGHITLFGTDVSALGDRAGARIRSRHIGFVFQNDLLLPRLTVLENVMLPCVYARDTGATRDHGIATLRSVGLEDKVDRFPHQLSGGERQRAALARAIINRPHILLADEPTGNLDSQTAHAIMDLVHGFNEQGVTVVVVTHDSRVAQRCAHNLHIEDGRLLS